MSTNEDWENLHLRHAKCDSSILAKNVHANVPEGPISYDVNWLRYENLELSSFLNDIVYELETIGDKIDDESKVPGLV